MSLGGRGEEISSLNGRLDGDVDHIKGVGESGEGIRKNIQKTIRFPYASSCL